MKYYYEVLVYDDMPKKSLVELSEGMMCWKGVRKVEILDFDVAALREEVERLRERGEALGAMLYEINSMNDTANLNDFELWNVNGETQNRIDTLLNSVALKGE